jgi:hypothetical protein
MGVFDSTPNRGCDLFAACDLSVDFISHQASRYFSYLQHSLRGTLGWRNRHLPASRGFDGEHVPSVLGDDVGHDEINLVLGVGVDASPASVRTYLVETTVGGAMDFTCTRHKRWSQLSLKSKRSLSP